MEKKSVKKLDLNQKEWEINGNQYYIESDITAIRYKYYEKYSFEFGYGVDFGSFHNNLGKAINLINDSKTVQGHSMLYNMHSSMNDHIENRISRAFKLCSLFLLREGEDPGKYDERLEAEKVKDFEDSGISYNDFFVLAFSIVPELLDALEKDSLKDLKAKKGKKK